MVYRVTGPPAGSGHWFEDHSLFVRYLIARHSHNRMDVLVSYAENEAALPVFSTKQAAWQFLRSTTPGSEWHVRESTAGELISLLMGHIADVEMVVLDPSAGSELGADAPVEHISKNEFIGSLMKEPMLMSPH